ncbi:FAD-dependent oxidoreductase [Tenacibaculum sp. 190524A05c]|uniref:Gamma-glutamylputrescine oxidase n=1 Tax=Tenacibaculum platacis TaxID=3137852 RepID=A0ABM9NUZ2_9FLAO
MNQLSYWEIKQWFQQVDFTIVGSGIVGLNCALSLKKKQPNAKILVLEKGMLPQGASTKNAGFACFGSLSELIDDLNSHSEEEVVNLVRRRWEGLQFLRSNLGDENLDFQQNKGFELFDSKDLYSECLSRKEEINKLLHPIFKSDVFSESTNVFKFKNVEENYIVNHFEGQIDTGKMMFHLLKKCQESGIKILNNTSVDNFEDHGNHVSVQTSDITFTTNKLMIATNGFAKQLIDQEVKPARAQVLITKPIKNLHIKGTFHLEKGYYYFRNIDDRILLGGGRNLDFKAEETTEFALTDLVQSKLDELLQTTILPNIDVEVDHRWTGIMGVGTQKKSIVKPISENVFCGVRLGGMGVAIGSLVGKELADLI